MNLKREHKIGLTMMVAAALAIFGIYFLKGIDLFKSSSTYHVEYSSIDGLSEASPLLMNGFKVGQVIKAQLSPENQDRILVTYHITESELEIPVDSKIEIFSADLFTKAARLILGSSTELAEGGSMLGGGNQLSLTESLGEQIDPLKKKAEGMIASIDSVLSAFQQVLNSETQGNISASFKSIRGTLDALDNTAGNLDDLMASETATMKRIIEDLNQVSSTLAANSSNLGRMMSNMATFTDTLASAEFLSTMTSLSSAADQANQLMSKLNEGNGTLGQLMNNDSLYMNLQQASLEMEKLAEDMRLNPKRYVHLSVFGKRDKLPVLSETDIDRIRQDLQD